MIQKRTISLLLLICLALPVAPVMAQEAGGEPAEETTSTPTPTESPAPTPTMEPEPPPEPTEDNDGTATVTLTPTKTPTPTATLSPTQTCADQFEPNDEPGSGIILMRLTEAIRARGDDWSVTWVGEQGASFFDNSDKPTPVIAPDGLAIVQQRRGEKVATLPLFVELDRGREAHGRPSSDWGRKVQGYNRFYAHNWKMHPHLSDLPTFPWVAVITHGARRLLNLAHAIKKHRREPVIYYLALWDDPVAEDDILARPAWLILTQEGKVIGLKRDRRQPLLPGNGET